MLFEYDAIFHSNGLPLAGKFFRNTDSLDEKQPTVVVTGSWLTVKEQMPSFYARRLAERGYTTFVFDFAGFGQSPGEPRQAEMPARKISDIIAAAEFVATMSFAAGQVGHLAICASAQYTLAAIARGAPIRSFASVAGWFHDAASVAPFYGGKQGVAPRIERARQAIRRFAEAGEVELVPAYKPSDEQAGMSFEIDYYGNPARGALRKWKNEMATMSWFYWLTFDGLRAAPGVTTPALFVHSDGCVLPDNLKWVHANVKGPKQLVWVAGSQADFYDRPELVDPAIAAADEHFRRTLKVAS